MNYKIKIKITNIKDEIYYIETTYINEDPNYNYESTKYSIYENNTLTHIKESGYHKLVFEDTLKFTYTVNDHPLFGNLVGIYNLKKKTKTSN